MTPVKISPQLRDSHAFHKANNPLRSPEDRGPSEMSVNANWISDKYAIYATVDTELIVGVPKSPAS
jgi:hypothetical protein